MQLYALIIFTACYLLLPHCTHSALTEEQMEQTAATLRKMCQPRFKVEDALVDGIKHGQFPDDYNLKCYVNCVLELMQLSKRGVINYDASVKQINALVPEHLREVYIRSLDLCKDSIGDTKDRCEASYNALQCFEQNNPVFIFP